MLNNKSKTPHNSYFIQNESEVSENVIKQVNYLQKVIGNKEVEVLINNGILNNASPQSQEQGIIADQNKKEEYESKQIQIDREALMNDVEQYLLEQKENADKLYQSGGGSSVYVNVKTHLVYAEIPGKPASLFYHYTDLVDVAFSYQNINGKGDHHKMKRGEYIPYTFSFKYEPPKDGMKNIPDQEPEESLETKEAPKEKAAPPTEKEGTDKIKNKEISATIFNAEKKINKNS
ncbi:MAG: hypothetical protein OQK82_06940 [Candidatus Pacearchaeota archaeon]|nr:hypothetical protein [Candidatus Pacearchaeota archaeon]